MPVDLSHELCNVNYDTNVPSNHYFVGGCLAYYYRAWHDVKQHSVGFYDYTNNHPNFPDPAGPGGGETEPEPTHSEGENSASTKAASTTASTTSSTSSCMKTLTASEVVVSCFSMNNTALCQTASSIQITGCDVTATVTTEYASCPTMDPDDQGSCGSNSTLPGNSTITSTAMSSTMTTLKSSLLPSTLTTIGTSGVSGSNGNVSPMQTSSLASMTGGSTRYDFGLYTAVYTSGGSTNTYIKLGPLSSCWVDSSPHTNAALGPFPSVTGFVSTTAPYATTITAGIELPSGICGSGSAYKCSEFGVDGVNDMFCGSFDGSPGIACVQPNRSFETTCSASSGGAAVKLTLGLACAGGPACGPTATDAPFTDTATSTSSVGTTLPIAPTIGTGPAPTQAQSSWAIYQVILGSAGGKADTYVLPGPYSECVTDLHVGAAVQIVSGNPLGTDPVPSDPFASTLGTFGWTQGLCGNTDDYRCYPSNEESTSYECYDESKTNGGFGCTEASDIWSTTCGGSATVSMMLGCWGGPQCYVTTPASVSAPTTKVKPSPALTIPPTPAPKPYTWGLYGIEYVNLNDPQGISPQGIGPFGNLKDAQGIDPSGGFPRLIQPGPLHKCQSNEYAWPAVDLAGYTSGPLPRTPPASSFGSFAWPSGLCGVTIPYRCSPQDTQTETIDCFGPTAKAWDIHCTIASTSWEISCLNAQESVSASASLAYYCTATSVDCANYPGAPRQGFEVTGATTTLQQRPSPTQHVKRSDQLAKRVNKPVSYAQAICRADEIFAMLKSDDAQQSAFTNYNALAQTGYIFKITDPIDAALDPVFQGLSIDKHNFQGWSALVRLFCLILIHELISILKYNPSDGTRQIQYTFYVNPQEGALVVEFAKGPINPLPANTPQRLSDIIFLVWQHYCSTATPAVEPGSLKYLIHRMVYNPSTQEILEQATANAGSKMQAWPGTPLDPTTDPGKAIVGSPNGYGVGFLMASHNTVFGDMTYQKITAFLDSYGDEGIVFEIGTASASKARRQAEEPNNGAQPGSGSRSTLSTIPVKTEAARVFPGTSAYNADFRGGLDDQPVWQYGIATTATGNDEW
ncbi:MAG: hypothetical protein LQ340_006108 [Diploschistes diacapsis]|nr:MAG: hypothetical protein LQ340_006108 [Diploschistes diacapsis]